MKSIDILLSDLMITQEQQEVERIVLTLVKRAEGEMDDIVERAVKDIRRGIFDGSKWSTLAFSLLEHFEWPKKPGEILMALVENNENDGAYLNNYGVFLEQQKMLGQAIEFFTRAYATDYKHHGHENASTMPAWMNLHRITSFIDEK